MASIDLGSVMGPPGPKGDKGDTGQPGITYLPEIGGVTTLPAGSEATAALGLDPDEHIAEFYFGIPKGDTGDTGPKGDKGDKGDTGPKGDKGDAGNDGTTYTPSIGAVTTLPEGSSATASVSVNTSDNTAAFSFGIPRGAKGDTGDTGQKGDKGETGAIGESGATFTPSVSDSGVISWTNDKGLENPADVDLARAVEKRSATLTTVNLEEIWMSSGDKIGTGAVAYQNVSVYTASDSSVIEILPSMDLISAMQDTGTTNLWIDNKDGVCTAYCVGGPPKGVMNIDVLVIDTTLKIDYATSFSDDTDEKIAKTIDAAQSGLIDLQKDCGWNVGDTRTIQISSFADGSGTSHAAQDIDIVISSFDDYNGCGCIMQFDFKDALATAIPMYSSKPSQIRYDSSEMYLTTLPALAEALPTWLQNRLIEFSVKANVEGMYGYGISTIYGNKLSLRSEIEIFGSTSYSGAGEGSQIPYYAESANRIKNRGHGGEAGSWLERSFSAQTTPYANCSVSSSGTPSFTSVDYPNGVAPFGCV